MKGFRTVKKLFGNLSIGYHAGGDVNHYFIQGGVRVRRLFTFRKTKSD